MFEIEGQMNTAICYAKVVEQDAIEQIKRMCDYEFTKDSKIRIMPDVHAGKGCTIGTTMTVHDKVVPNIVGVDIGCGMYTVNLGNIDILCFLYGKYLEDYLYDVEICQDFVRRNREKIADILLQRTGLQGSDGFHTVHNYIDTKEMILRKGAIAAHEGERVLIPINMRDGSVLAVGKGNPEWNYSAPHGAGRLMSRRLAKEQLNMDDYREMMKGIYTTSVCMETLDEAPMAYKSLDDIIDVIQETVDVIGVMKPIYNFKAN